MAKNFPPRLLFGRCPRIRRSRQVWSQMAAIIFLRRSLIYLENCSWEICCSCSEKEKNCTMESLAAVQEELVVSNVPPLINQHTKLPSVCKNEDPCKMVPISSTCLMGQISRTGGFPGVHPAISLPCLDGPDLVSYIPAPTTESSLAQGFPQSLGRSGMAKPDNQHRPGMYSVEENQGPESPATPSPAAAPPPPGQKKPPPREDKTTQTLISGMIIVVVCGICAVLLCCALIIGLSIHFTNKTSEAIRDADASFTSWTTRSWGEHNKPTRGPEDFDRPTFPPTEDWGTYPHV